jgi:phage/plasmid-like protein (TIGR03299 family)
MAASLFGERFIGRREPAWHRLGEVFPADEKMTATQAMERADIMFGIDKHPQVVKMDDGTELATDSYAVVREPTADDPQPRVLATVGKDWTAIQARDLGEMLDPISKRFPVETAGAIGQGEKIFITLDAGASSIAGEDHKLFWLVTDHRDGTGALSIAFTPVRVVCQNTLITGLRSSKVSVNLKHNKSIAVDTSFYLDIFNQMARTQETVVEAMNSLTKVTLKKEQVADIMSAAYPTASKPNRLKLSDGISADDVPAKVWVRILNDRKDQVEEFEKRQARVTRIRDNALERVDIFNQEFSGLANTPWAVYNAIVETEDYRRGWDGSGTALFGQRAEAKARAFNKALSYV